MNQRFNDKRRRTSFMVIIEVNGANPNGDAETGIPRKDTAGYGVINQDCIKRMIRNYIVGMDMEEILLKTTDDSENYEARNTRYFKNKEIDAAIGDIRKLIEISNRIWFDVRAFGLMMLNKSKKNRKAAKAENQDMDVIVESEHDENFGIKGAVTIGNAVSVQTVEIENMTISSSYNQKQDGYEKESSTFGSSKKCIRHGIYVLFGGITPLQAIQNGFTEADRELLKDALANLYEYNESATRPEGSVTVRQMFWWEYDGKDYKPAQIRDSVKIKLKEGVETPTSIDDYIIEVHPLEATKTDHKNYGANLKLL